MRKVLLSILLLFIISYVTFAGTFSNSVSASEGALDDSWNTKALMNYPRQNLGVIAVEGQIYAIGGHRLNDASNIGGMNERYDPKTDKWTELASMPTPMSNFAIATYQGKIYCIGSTPPNMYGRGETYSMNEVYDIDTDSWSTKTALPVADTKFHKAYVIDENIFVLADCDLFMYDPATNLWTAKTSIPEESLFSSVTSFVVDNKILVVDVFKLENFTLATKTLVYDPYTDLWSERANPPFTTISGTVGVTSGIYAPQRVYIFSSNLIENTTSTLVYDPAKDTWSVSEGMPTMRYACGAAAVDDVLYVVGGSIPGQSLATNEQYVPLGYHGPLFSGSIFTLANIALATGIVVIILAVVVVLLFFSKKKKIETPHTDS